MEQYISKSAVLAEIKRRKELVSDPILLGNDLMIGERNAYFNLLSFLDTLEVKEVNLEKELDSMITPELKFHKALPSLFDVAKHFFELGLSSQLSWKDIELIAEIGMDFMSSEDSYNLNDEEYYAEILNRFKAQKGK